MYEKNADQRVSQLVDKEVLDLSEMTDPGLRTVLSYWNEARDDGVGPPVARFRLEKLPPDLIASTAVVDFLGPPFDFRYRFFGTRMVEMAGQELTGKRYYADGVTGFGFINAEIYPLMIERRAPVYTRARWISVKHLRFSTITLRLPLSEDGAVISGGVTVDRFAAGHG